MTTTIERALGKVDDEIDVVRSWGDIDVQLHRHLRCGDSLLGITSLDQLRWLHMDPERGREIHGEQPVPEEWITLTHSAATGRVHRSGQ